jgi:hypothetical protein
LLTDCEISNNIFLSAEKKKKKKNKTQKRRKGRRRKGLRGGRERRRRKGGEGRRKGRRRRRRRTKHPSRELNTTINGIKPGKNSNFSKKIFIYFRNKKIVISDVILKEGEPESKKGRMCMYVYPQVRRRRGEV